MGRFLMVISFLSCIVEITFCQIQFSDIAQTAGVWELGTNYGVAIADYDNDGWEDIYVTRKIGPNRLFRNLGNETFEEVAEQVGVAYAGTSQMAVWGDINNDGWLDMLVGNNEKGETDVLYLNNGDGTFKDISREAGMLHFGDVMAVMFGDLDNDSLIDIYVARWNSPNTLYMNQGGTFFRNEITSRGCQDTRVAMGGILFDYDNDRDLDIYLVHDGRQANYLFENDGNGYFTDVAKQVGVDYKGFGMGVDVADINNDGWLDIYITNLYPNALLVNNQDGTFSDITSQMQVGDDGMGWGTSFMDVDNDCWQDLYFTNTNPTKPNLLYQNIKGEAFHRTVSTLLESTGNSFGIASTDFNKDGKMDFFVTNSNDQVGNHLFKNETENGNNWLQVKTIGTVGNHTGIGARVEVKIGDYLLTEEVNSGCGYASQNSLQIHFGLGEYEQVDQLSIKWPSGIIDVFSDISANQLLVIEEGSSQTTSIKQLDKSDFFSVFPNPISNEATTLKFELNTTTTVAINIYNSTGQLVQYIPQKVLEVGQHQLPISLKANPAGVYFLTIAVEKETLTKKILITK